MPFIYCEVSLTLTSPRNCVLTDMTTRAAKEDNQAIIDPTGATFNINDAKLYVQVVTLSTADDNKLSQPLKQDLKEQLNEINTD